MHTETSNYKNAGINGVLFLHISMASMFYHCRVITRVLSAMLQIHFFDEVTYNQKLLLALR